MIELHAIFHGKVQGVGFRHTTLKLAGALGLKGYVCNCRDGTVELLAHGTKKQLDLLLDGLDQAFGPRWIERVDTDFHDPKGTYTDFTILI